MTSPELPMSFRVPMYGGPYQDNGASPWYAPISVGTSTVPQVQFFALDTGTNMDWVTSTQCTTHACMIHKRFDPSLSSTFQPIQSQTVTLSYGPWGNLEANIGTDVLNLPGGHAQRATFGLAVNYGGPQFEEIDWSACLAFPSQGTMQYGFSNVMQDMLRQGVISPYAGYVCFDWNRETRTGSCLIGDVDLSGVDPAQYIVLPFDSYTPVPSVNYIWTCAGATVTIGSLVMDDIWLCLDSGSSRFKGGVEVIDQIKANLGGNTNTLTIDVGQARGGARGRIVVPPELYMRTIEEGENKGQTLPQFNVLGELPGLLLVGSVLMDYLYTIYVYDTVSVGGVETFQAAGMIIFNKADGPPVIRNDGAEAIRDAAHLRAVFDETVRERG
ncbi:pepsin-like aspartyl protease [Tropicibacter sp. S64]|uniref:pepsin-like aspartyl protease n=1 Tax=Tropicibacter sp. S64 TaxID=3415122 RepID=UPI003C79777D